MAKKNPFDLGLIANFHRFPTIPWTFFYFFSSFHHRDTLLPHLEPVAPSLAHSFLLPPPATSCVDVENSGYEYFTPWPPFEAKTSFRLSSISFLLLCFAVMVQATNPASPLQSSPERRRYSKPGLV
ncbi:hypothetical protein DSL72_005956 [Monilinia vaccinii-corymbosi]|uniref:Uncharacterized protein n=1 Tax=Monilinia vaccinii-corymbosi TaxID=61207 RepID=A0A8A3PH48_9HELO|nr:hypothetical protein DSL72_005956 [Monilinia vaccinii-corymbosi]